MNAKEMSERIPSLSPREHEILELLALGLSDAKISETIGISVHTVRHHTQSIHKKLDTYDQTQTVTKGISLGLLNLDRLTSNFDLDHFKLLLPHEKNILADLANFENIPGNKSAGSRNFVTKGAVEANMQYIFAKLGVENRTQAAVFYLAATKRHSTSEASFNLGG